MGRGTRRWCRRHALALLTVIIGMSIGTGVAADTTTYVDPLGRFSFTPPDGYDLRTPGALGLGLLTGSALSAFFSPTFADAAIGVRVVTNDPQRHPPVQVATDALNDAAGQPGTSAISPYVQGTVLGDRPAVLIGYAYLADGMQMHLQQVAVQNGSNLYIITFAAREHDFDPFLEETKVVLNSFSFGSVN